MFEMKGVVHFAADVAFSAPSGRRGYQRSAELYCTSQPTLQAPTPPLIYANITHILYNMQAIASSLAANSRIEI